MKHSNPVPTPSGQGFFLLNRVAYFSMNGMACNDSCQINPNYTHSEINVVDGEIDTLTVAPRLGVLVETSALKGSGALWIGAMYMDYDQTVTDSVNLKAVDSRLPDIEIDFEVRIKNKDPWNFIFGGQWEITKQWQIVAEGGVGDRKQVITGIFFRF